MSSPSSYQVRYGLLHAAHYGVPQDRRRIIFVATLRGLFLPELPQPSHLCTKSQDLAINVDSPDSPQSFAVNRRRKESAPLGIITVMDAISDLPQWEWCVIVNHTDT
jgi:DNA (cytosine-5)-methyltransferase 1